MIKGIWIGIMGALIAIALLGTVFAEGRTGIVQLTLPGGGTVILECDEGKPLYNDYGPGGIFTCYTEEGGP